ncbi:MAG: efflux RND transporter periplasmic adaptor subunit [Gammaproteobacteria bacterium]|nr:efflux RND transporter periplasmic adaptor subunit [Gammaproteobacteria bacterium]MDH3857478.1 efflux RND transporter periplasmic adaptor subunit [Gammaproteobacteria bacterium]
MRFLPSILFFLGITQASAIELNGRTEFAQLMSLNSSISGRVASIKVSAGQQVSAGELLLTFVPTGFKAEADFAQAQRDSLLPTVDRMQTEMEKAQELFDRDSLSLVDLNTAEQNLAIAEAKLAAAEAKLTQALFRLSQTEIRAPTSGIVLDIATFSGQYINTRVSNQTLLTIADNSSMVVNLLIPIDQLSDSLLNKNAKVSFQKQDYQGKVVGISKQASIGSNNYPAMSLQVNFSADDKLPAGIPVTVIIEDD